MAEPQGASASCAWITRTWLVPSVTGDHKRLHLVVVISILSSLHLSWSHSFLLLLQTTTLFFYFKTLHLSSPLHLFLSPTCAVLFSLHPPFPFAPYLPQPLSPHLLTPPRPGLARPDHNPACPGSFCIKNWDRNHTLAVLWLWRENICQVSASVSTLCCTIWLVCQQSILLAGYRILFFFCSVLTMN